MTTTSTQQGVMTDDARIRELLLLNLFAVFSERDPERRMNAIVANYTEDVIWSNPEATTQGHEALHERAQQLLDRTPDFVFTAAGPVHVVRDLATLPSPWVCLSSRLRPSATTWRWYATDGSPCCTRC
jgi:hypothetical protein